MTAAQEPVVVGEQDALPIVSHGDLLSVFNTMFMGLDIESMNTFEAFGLAGGVSYMYVDDGRIQCGVFFI